MTLKHAKNKHRSSNVSFWFKCFMRDNKWFGLQNPIFVSNDRVSVSLLTGPKSTVTALLCSLVMGGFGPSTLCSASVHKALSESCHSFTSLPCCRSDFSLERSVDQPLLAKANKFKNTKRYLCNDAPISEGALIVVLPV